MKALALLVLGILAVTATAPSFAAGTEVFKLSDKLTEEGATFLGDGLTMNLSPGKDGKIKFKLPDLPEHRFLKLKLDVDIAGSKNSLIQLGGAETESNSRLKIVTGGGMTLLDSSFSSMSLGQSFPDRFGSFLHAPGTGGQEPKEKGAQVAWFGQASGKYSFELLFPHDAKKLELDFLWDKGEAKGAGLGNGAFRIQINGMNLGGGPFSLSELRVTAFDRAPTVLDEAKANALLSTISGRDAVAAHAALNGLIGAGEAILPFVRAHFSIEPDPHLAEKIEALFAGLRSDEFKVRTRAEVALGKLGSDALPHIVAELADSDSLSVDVRSGLKRVKTRLEKALKASSNQALANRLRPALAMLGSDDAKAIESTLPAMKKIDLYEPPKLGEGGAQGALLQGLNFDFNLELGDGGDEDGDE